jgi:hypothetical protein
MRAYRDAFPTSDISGRYFHLCQSVVQEVKQCGLKSEYKTDDEILGFIKCLAALSHVPVDDVVDAFEQLVEPIPLHDRVNDVATHFEPSYVRDRRRPGRGNTMEQLSFQFHIRTSTSRHWTELLEQRMEEWHYTLPSLLMCQHSTT